MSIEYFRDLDINIPTCDFCGVELEGCMEFDAAVQQKKSNGWKSQKDEKGVWWDMCPECQKLMGDKNLTTAADDFGGITN